MSDDALKRNLILLIGAAIDEETVPGVENSFVEMANAVIHYAGDGGERYFRVVLVDVSKAEYWNPYDPGQAA